MAKYSDGTALRDNNVTDILWNVKMAVSVDNSILFVGAEFASFSELQTRIREYEVENFVELYTRSSRTLEAMRKRAPKRSFNPLLAYGELKYACIHGGRNYKSASTGVRPQQHTFQRECPFSLKIATTDDGARLVVKEMNDKHNHETSENAFNRLPRERRLCGDVRASAMTALKLKCDKKLLRRHIEEETGQTVLMKDLHNLGQAFCDKKLLQGHIEQGTEQTVLVKDLHNLGQAFRNVASQLLGSKDRYRKVVKISNELCILMSEAPLQLCDERMNLLTGVIDAWKANKHVSVSVNDGPDDCFHIDGPPSVFSSSDHSDISVADDDINVSLSDDKSQMDDGLDLQEPSSLSDGLRNIVITVHRQPEQHSPNSLTVDAGVDIQWTYEAVINGLSLSGVETDAVAGSSYAANPSISDLTLPPKLHRRSQPVGAETSVITNFVCLCLDHSFKSVFATRRKDSKSTV